ncbi:MAG: hypothetical protein PHH54_03000 [Candidatus Nanoarchaeia archaeon]|nr:hypothetical protein [Candidatus Nanoarchaeia archaeon]MDD5740928.1 hypothetical protein [Candidatus Nanoarchaeia archaeon]
MRKIKTFEWIILLFNIIYLVIFTFIFAERANYEFLLYTVVVAFFVVFIAILHLKYNFSYFVLSGLSMWGLLHMLGGGIIANKMVLYAYQLLPFLRYDMFVHLFGFFFATLFSYYVLKPYLKKTSFAVLIFLAFIGMGLGALNEIVEFIAVLVMPQTGVGGYENTMLDIVFNTIGSILAVIWIKLKEKS